MSIDGLAEAGRRRLGVFEHLGHGATKAQLALGATILISLLLSATLAVINAAPATERDALAREQRPGLDNAAANERPLPRAFESTELVSYLLKLAKDSSVEIVSIEARGTEGKRFEAASLKAHRYDVRLRARLSQLVAFLNRFEQARTGQNPTQNVDRNVFLEALVANPESDQNWLVSAELFVLAAAD